MAIPSNPILCIKAALGPEYRIIVTAIFLVHLLFDMALFYLLLKNTLELCLIHFSVVLSSRVLISLMTAILTIFILLFRDMSAIICFSIIGTISTFILCCLVLISCIWHMQTHVSDISELFVVDSNQVFNELLQVYGIYR